MNLFFIKKYDVEIITNVLYNTNKELILYETQKTNPITIKHHENSMEQKKVNDRF